jgi:hypothetical protein
MFNKEKSLETIWLYNVGLKQNLYGSCDHEMYIIANSEIDAIKKVLEKIKTGLKSYKSRPNFHISCYRLEEVKDIVQ